jgi:hypothetical protein
MSGARGHESKELDPAELVGRAITGVLGDRALPYRIEGGSGMDPPGSDTIYAKSDLVYWHLDDLWVETEGLEWVVFFGEALVLARPEPGLFLGTGYGEQRRVSPIDAPAPLAALVGATITVITPLYTSFYLRPRRWWRRKERTGKYLKCGHIFETTNGSVAIANVDPRPCRYAVGKWPGDKERWQALNVVTDVDPRHVP